MTANITVKSTAPASKTMSDKKIFQRIESAKVGGRKKMLWFTEDQANLMQQLRTFEPDLSDSKIIRKAMNLYLRMHKVKGNSKRSA